MQIGSKSALCMLAVIGCASACRATTECPSLLVQTGDRESMVSIVLFSVSPDFGYTDLPQVAIGRRLKATWDAAKTPLHDTFGCGFDEDIDESDSGCVESDLDYVQLSTPLITSVPSSAYGAVPFRSDIYVFAESGIVPNSSNEPRWYDYYLGPRFIAGAIKERRRDNWYWNTADTCGGCTAKDPVIQEKEEVTNIWSVDDVAYDIVSTLSTGVTVDLSFLVRYETSLVRGEFCPDPLADYFIGGATHVQKVTVTAYKSDSSTETWVAFDGRVVLQDGVASNAYTATPPALDFGSLTDMFSTPYYVLYDCLVQSPQVDYTRSVASYAYGDTTHHFDGDVCRIVIRREYKVDGGADDPPIFTCELPEDEGVVCEPGCPPCPADFDMNGGVDGADLNSYLGAFELGDPCADLNGDGGIDSTDLAIFFSLYQLGGCE